MSGAAFDPARPFAVWPPLITSARRPRWVLVRDIVLTLLMWALLGLILLTEFELLWSWIEVQLGRPDAVVDARLEAFWNRLRPLLWVIAVLTLLLAGSTLLSRRRRERALQSPPPPPLAAAEIEARAGLDTPALADARALRIAIVHRSPAGALVVEPNLAISAPSV